MHQWLLKHNRHEIKVTAEQESPLRYSFELECLDCFEKDYFPFFGTLIKPEVTSGE